MLKPKYLSFLFLTLFIAMALGMTPLKSMAQDDSSNEEEIFSPQINSSSAPPAIIDESDSNSVNNIEDSDN